MKQSHLDNISHHCVHDLEDSIPILSHNTVAHDDASSHQVWLQKVEQLTRYLVDKTHEHGQTDMLIPATQIITGIFCMILQWTMNRKGQG